MAARSHQSFRIFHLVVLLTAMLFSIHVFAADSDGDGVDDAADQFPNDFCRSLDTDGDGKPNSLHCFYENFDGQHAGPALTDPGSTSCVSYPTTGGVSNSRYAQFLFQSINWWGPCMGGGWIELKIELPAPQTLTFYYKGEVYGGSSSFPCVSTWTQRSINLPAGAYTLRWGRVYLNNCSSSPGVDQIQLGPVTSSFLVQDEDDDNDGVTDTADKFPLNAAASVDGDDDGVPTSWNAACDATCQVTSGLVLDNCPSKSNANQLNTDGDVQGDACDADDDNDGVTDDDDSFPLDPSRSMSNTNILYIFKHNNIADSFGVSVSGAGDVNSDGYADVIVGAPEDNSNGTNSGSAYVFSGMNGAILYTFNGDTAYDYLGRSVSGAGDVNGDGYDDVIVGAPGTMYNGGNPGSAKVFSGLDGSVLYTFDADSTNDYFGASVSSAGDVNGDGYADVIVGASQDDNNGNNSGAARVFSGVDGSVLYNFSGDNAEDAFGTSVSGAGDVNGDGYADLIVGASHSDNNGNVSGMARVFSGVNGSVIYTLNGDRADDHFGISVSGAGDVNNDGYDDVIVGADGDVGKNPGSAHVFSGVNGSVLYTFDADSANDFFGRSVSDAGDMNNDGYADVIVGAVWDSNNGTSSGSARIFSGVDGSILYTFDGDSAGDNFGRSVSGAGDVNGDGYADVIVGTTWNTGDGNYARVFNGKGLWIDTDGDGQNDAVDTDDDNDGVVDTVDVFPLNPAQSGDIDGDGVDSFFDNCQVDGNTDQLDTDGDAQGDACDADDDNDGVIDDDDSFPLSFAASLDSDNDGFSESWNPACDTACQVSSGLTLDNCPLTTNTWQSDFDGDAEGDACDLDGDNDGVPTLADSFPYDATQSVGNSNTLNTFSALSAGDNFGMSVSRAGDVNNDGYDDVIVGAGYDDSNYTDSGSAWVFSGVNGTVLYALAGGSSYDGFGTSVSGAGDVNGDGYDDVIVGAPGENSSIENAGSARVFSGANGSILYTFYGDNSYDVFGYSVSGAGDVNNDGYADVIVGAYGDDNNGDLSGSARVFSGADGAILYTLNGDSASEVFGYAVSGAGDVNNDGYDDVIVGAYGDDNNGWDSGSAKVFSGANGSILYTFYGDNSYDVFGYSVSGAGDVNNDGYADVIVGAYGDDNNGSSSGSARVISGANGSILYTFNGDSVGDYFGRAVSGAGDVNNDGYDDVIVGANGDDNNGSGSGSARVISGANGSILYAFNGDSVDDYFGRAVSGAGDVNNDGYDDVIVGAYQDDNNGTDSGSVRIFNGKGLWTDNDSDGLNDAVDADDDNDGVPDINDYASLNPSSAGDGDSDGIDDFVDNCLGNANADQINTDGDLLGNACDSDDDNDGVADTSDKFSLNSAASSDSDSDGYPGSWNGACDATCQAASGLTLDNCPTTSNPTQANNDGDAQGDACDTDDDNDGVADTSDKFPLNPAASSDSDNDGYPGSWNGACDATCQAASGLTLDNCPTTSNPTQANNDGDAQGDACDTDDDNDGVVDGSDAFPLNAAESVDTDGDGTGNNGDADDDNDGVLDINDAFPLDYSEAYDFDGDGTGDNADTDDDNDGVADTADKFPLDANRWLRSRHNTDFDNDSDVLIRSVSTGAWTSYGIQNNTVINAAVMSAPTSSDSVYVAQLDANGDGDADILTRSASTGAWTLSIVESGAVTSSVPLYLYANLGYQFVGVGDFNNDGTDDVMLRHATQGYRVFLLQNHAVSSVVLYNAWVDASSVDQGIGDFNGDGTDDLLVRRTSDNLYFIFKTIDGAVNNYYCACNIWANPDWSFQFAGDTNKDGIDDIVIRGTGPTADGKWWAFRMNNFSSSLYTNLNLFINKTAITVGAVGDYNGDGTIDVLTRVNNSTTYVSPIVNGTITGNYWLYNFTNDQVIGK